MRTVTVDLFSGLGGFALASHMMGWETLILCEIDDNCKVVLAHHFPDAYIHGDIHTLTGDLIREKIKEKYGDEPVRIVLCGGFPCQPYSAAGKRLGKEDARHLWPEMLRVIRECRPDAVVGENVSGIVSWDGGLVFEEVQTDLEAEGYEVQAVVVPACSVGAPHRRDRVWFVANARNSRREHESIQQRRGCETSRHGEVSNIISHSSESWPPPHAQLPESQGRDEVEEGQQHGGWRLAWSQLASFGGAWPFAYASIEGRKEWEQDGQWENEAQSGSGMDNESERLGSEPDVTNAKSCGIQRDGAKGQQVEQSPIGEGLPGCRDSGTIRDYWQNFPTEPPLRVGDDGISARLGRVCLPGTKRKLTESSVNKMGLKMAGNAVVPQVVFQIFKALEATW